MNAPRGGEVHSHLSHVPPVAGEAWAARPDAPEAPPVTRALVITASNRASQGVYADKGGPLLAEALGALGFAVDGPRSSRTGTPSSRRCARAWPPGTTSS